MENNWHDLRKDPNDVPNKKGYYEIKFLHKKGTEDIEPNGFWNMKKWINFNNTVIAWRNK